MENKKPTLSQFGLTEQKVNYNEYAKKNGQAIQNENLRIDEKAIKYGWIAFIASFIILSLIGANAEIDALYFIFLIISAVIGYVTNAIIKKNKLEVPVYSKEVDMQYQMYLKAVAEYERLESLSKVKTTKTDSFKEPKESAKAKTISTPSKKSKAITSDPTLREI